MLRLEFVSIDIELSSGTSAISCQAALPHCCACVDGMTMSNVERQLPL